MRVLHIGKYFPPFAGGMEYFLADLAQAQAQAGAKVAVLVHSERRQGYRTLPSGDRGITVYRAPCYGQLLYAPVSPAFPFWLKRAISEFRPDLLHLHLPNTSALLALAVPAARRLPWVVHWHSDVVSSLRDRRLAVAYGAYRPLERLILEKAHSIIATSPPYMQSSEALRPWLSRCVTIPLGIDINRIAEPTEGALKQAEDAWGSATLRVLAIGRLTYYKGHEVLIRAAATVEDSRILIAGRGELKDHLASLARDLNLRNRVQLIGYQSEDKLNALLATTDVLCLPSVERTEAFGLVQLEAMCFAKAVVVSDIPGSGTGWVARLANNALLTKPDDPADLSEKLRLLREDPELRRALGAAGPATLAKHFDIGQVAGKVLAVYQGACADRSGRRTSSRARSDRDGSEAV
ncbi:glycosyltransferase [Thiorhodococcus mannitoliphagus]|nr:glycosyltransferase [Thiorhodococcus mannitoliphagus]